MKQSHATPSGAVFSPDAVYRYLLWRRWAEGPLLNCLMLNPSTATAEISDPTVSRCLNRARALGYPGLVVTNLFALRSTDPRGLQANADPVGPDNDAAIHAAATAAATVLCAWGGGGSLAGREAAVLQLLAGIPLFCLGRTNGGSPRHPLYLPRTAALVAYDTPEVGA